MKDLATRLAALDPDASAALRVIAHFDQLNGAMVGLPTIVREAAVLAGCPVRLVDHDRHLLVRAEPDGPNRPSADPITSLDAPASIDARWPWVPLPCDPCGHQGDHQNGGQNGRLWLERPGPADQVEAMVLERAANCAAAVLRRTRGARRTRVPDDPAYVDMLVDANIEEPERLWAARQLGMAPTTLAYAVAVPGGTPRIEPAEPGLQPGSGPQPGPGPGPGSGSGSQPGPQQGPQLAGRAGIGRVVPVRQLPESWTEAKIALRFTAEGSSADPGPRVVSYPDLGGLVLLAAQVGPGSRPVPDVEAVVRLAGTAPWALGTLTAVAEAASLRAAAGILRVHHSTLQDRLNALEHQLGWAVRDPAGRLRLQLALVLRRLHLNPA